MKANEIKIRKDFGQCKAYSSPMTTKKGKKGYNRKQKHKKPME